MDQLVIWIQGLLYSVFCGVMSVAIPLFFIVMAIQFITKGRVDPGKAIGLVFKLAITTVKLVTSGGRRRR